MKKKKEQVTFEEVNFLKRKVTFGPSQKKKKQIYLTHDNGGRPWKVVIFPLLKKVFVYQKSRKILKKEEKETFSPEWEKDLNRWNTKKLSFSYQKFWYGPDLGNELGFVFPPGSSLLFQIKKRNYIFIGRDINQFTLPEGDRVLYFTSIVGNNDVTWPYAIGRKFIYQIIPDMLEKKSILAIPLRQFKSIVNPNNKKLFDEFFLKIFPNSPNTKKVGKEHIFVPIQVLQNSPFRF